MSEGMTMSQFNVGSKKCISISPMSAAGGGMCRSLMALVKLVCYSLAFLILTGAAQVVSAQQIVEPSEGQKVVVGSLIKGPCQLGTMRSNADGSKYITGAAKSEVYAKGHGIVGSIDPPECQPVLTQFPGSFYIVKLTNLGAGQGAPGGNSETVNFEVVDKTCDFQAKDGNTNKPLSPSDLKAFGLSEKSGTQTIKTGAGQRLEITLADGSIMRIGPNTTTEFDPCDLALRDEGKKITVKLILGTVWYHVQKAVGGDPNFNVETERAVVGVRGTTFEVSNDPQKEITTVHVIEGSVAFNDLSGSYSITVTSGQSAIVGEDGVPKLVNSTYKPTSKPDTRRKP